jgi:hypothetical protein
MPDTPVAWAQLATRCYSDQPTFGAESSAARACVYAAGQVVGIPGTNNVSCWLADLNFDTVEVGVLGRLHEGFYRAFQAIEHELLELAPTHIVGHSEGAALALIYAAHLCAAGKPPEVVWAWEPPRVSTDSTLRAFFAKYDTRLILLHHGRDVVPDVPRLFGDWQHPGDLLPFPAAAHDYPNVDDHLLSPGIIRDAAGLVMPA